MVTKMYHKDMRTLSTFLHTQLMPACIQVFVEFIPHYAVADSSKYTFPVTVKGLRVLCSGDGQCCAPII